MALESADIKSSTRNGLSSCRRMDAQRRSFEKHLSGTDQIDPPVAYLDSTDEIRGIRICGVTEPNRVKRAVMIKLNLRSAMNTMLIAAAFGVVGSRP
jgi:hypothetical protein